MGKKNMRHAVQALWAVCTNSYAVGFVEAKIYRGKLKNICLPGLNCYSCPGAVGACPIGALHAVMGSWKFSVSLYVAGFFMLVGAVLGRFVCGFLCPFGLVQDLLHKIPFPKKIRTFHGDRALRLLKYVILLVFVILLPLFAVDIIGQTILANAKLSNAMEVLAAKGRWSADIFQVFYEMDRYAGRGVAAELYFQSQAIKLMSLFLRLEQQKSEMNPFDLQGLTAVLQYITANLESEIKQPDLAYISHMSASKLKGIFKDFTGKTMRDYILMKRMNKAMELLVQTQAPIEKIVPMVGFQTPAGFSAAFRKFTGYTPRDFRKRMDFCCNINPSVNYEITVPPKVLSPTWRRQGAMD